MKGYKGFNKGLICRGKKYAENKTFEEGSAEICKNGMHFCALPHQVFEYYSPGENHEFAEVESLDDTKTDDNRKYCAKKLRIGAKISVFDICKISVSAFFERFDFFSKIKKAKESRETNAGDWGAANAGYCGAANAGNRGAANAGNRGAANAGDCGAANAGDCGAANAGDWGAANAGYCGAANAGNRGAANAGNRGAANAGDCGAANAGDCGAANAGDRGAANAGNRGAANAGNWGAAIVRAEGKASAGTNGIAIALGNKAAAKGKRGAVLVLTEWDDKTDDIKYVKAVKVTGRKIKEDTYYTLIDGKIVEATNHESNI